MTLTATIRPLAEAKLTLLPRIRLKKGDRLHIGLCLVRFIQALLCLHCIFLLNRFEMFTLFEINCGPSKPQTSVRNGQTQLVPDDSISTGPNLAYDQIRFDRLEEIASQHWLFCKKTYRSFGFLTSTGRSPASVDRVYHIRNWMKLPFTYYAILLPNSCEAVPQVRQFKDAVHQAAEAYKKKQEEAKANQANAALCANGSNDSANDSNLSNSSSAFTSNEPDKESDESQALYPGTQIQIMQTAVSDYFQIFARFIQVSGVFSMISMVIYGLCPSAYLQNRFYLMCFDTFFSGFMLFGSVFSTNYFADGVNELYDG